MEIVVDYFLDSVIQWVISKVRVKGILLLVWFLLTGRKGSSCVTLFTFSKAEVMIFSG